MPTTMNKQGKFDWNKEAGENIGKDKFGFCFCANHSGGAGKIPFCYVYCARNMAFDSNGQFKPIYTTLTMDFILQYLRLKLPNKDGVFIVSDVEECIDNGAISEWLRQGKQEKGVPINSIFKKGDDVKFEESTIKVRFNQTEVEQLITVEQDESPKSEEDN